jgi:hypothetical protein
VKRACLFAALALAGPITARADSPSGLPPRVEGVVLDREGQPVAGADVVLRRPDGTARRVAVTDEAGAFALLPAHLGQARLLIVSGRGTRSYERRLELLADVSLSLRAGEDESPGRLALLTMTYGSRDISTLDVVEGTASARHRDLASALVALAGTSLATAPAGGPVLAGLPWAELPVFFQGLRLNDPLTGAAPLDLAPSLFGAAVIEDLAPPRLVLSAPEPADEVTEVLAGGDLTTHARGADGANRPQGMEVAGQGRLALDLVARGGRARGGGRVVFDEGAYVGDPSSATALRGRRASRAPVLLFGEADAGGWQLRSFVLTNLSNASTGRGERVAVAGEPGTEGRALAVLGASAHRQLAPGANDVGVTLGLQGNRRRAEPVALAPIEDIGRRLGASSTLRLAGHLAGLHQGALTLSLDWEHAERKGRELGRQPSGAPEHTEVSGVFPGLLLRERYVPVGWLALEAGLELSTANYRVEARMPGGTSLTRAYDLDLLWAPRFAISLYPVAASTGAVLAVHAIAARTGTRLPLAVGLAAPEDAAGDLPQPAEDSLALGADYGTRVGTHAATVGLWAHARRAAHVVEDRFAPSSGQLQLFSPPSARRDYRALSARAGLSLAPFFLSASAVLSRLTGNYAGFVDEVTGQLRPAGTGAFDGPDVLVNRSGRLPFDRAYGLRAAIDGDWAWSSYFLHTSLRGRLDGGTPRSATIRSAASGEGQVFLVERGSLGRTRWTGSLDAAVSLRRRFHRLTGLLALEGFNLTQYRPVTARDPRYSDTVPGQPFEPRASFERPIAYAEPLLVRLLAGVAF